MKTVHELMDDFNKTDAADKLWSLNFSELDRAVIELAIKHAIADTILYCLKEQVK